jgi:hypothetical protein
MPKCIWCCKSSIFKCSSGMLLLLLLEVCDIKEASEVCFSCSIGSRKIVPNKGSFRFLKMVSLQVAVILIIVHTGI